MINISLTSKVIILMILAYIFITFLVYLNQRSLLYLPNVDSYDDEDLIIEVENISILNSDGNSLRSIFYKHPSNTKKTLVMFHGNAGPIENRFYKVNKLSKYKQNILLISWRSYSGNSGNPSEEGLYDDAVSAINWLNKRDIKEEDIVIYGESLGTAISIEIAQNKSFKGIILEAPFTSMIDAAKHHYPYLPVSFLLKDQYLSANKIKKIKSPILFLHAEGDNIVPFWMGEKMYKLANSPKMKFFNSEQKHLLTFDEELMNSMDNFYHLINTHE